MPQFTLDGHKVWCYTLDEVEGWAIVKDNDFDPPKLKHLTGQQPEGYPWIPLHGYRIMDDGWLLWLPPHWRSVKKFRKWSSQFLVFLHPELSEAVILELLAK